MLNALKKSLTSSVFAVSSLIQCFVTSVPNFENQCSNLSYNLVIGEAPAANEAHGDHRHHHEQSEGLDSAVGMSLVLGFIFMLLIDQLANAKQSRTASVVSISGSDIEVQSSGRFRK